MRHEKILKRADGTKIRVKVNFWVESYGNTDPNYDVSIHYCSPKKRTWYGVVDTNCVLYRRESRDGRNEIINQANLKYATPEEIHQAKLELWEKMKPKL